MNPDAKERQRQGAARGGRAAQANGTAYSMSKMTPERRREIAAMGGRAAHAKGTGHVFTKDEARVAGRLGGRKVAADRAHMSEIGRRGGRASQAKKRAARAQRDMFERADTMPPEKVA